MIKTKDRADKEKKRKKILRKQGKEEEGLYLGGGLGACNRDIFFLSAGGWAYKWRGGVGSGRLLLDFTVFK